MSETSRPVVHVIIPSYNTADYLCRCLDSLRAPQGELQLEIHVVDNASVDDTIQRVREGYPEVHLLVSGHNGGFAYAVNMALRQVLANRPHGPYYVLLLNSDTELPPTTIGRMIASMEEHPEAGAVGPQLILADGRLDLACRRSFPTPEVAFYRLFGLSLLFPRSRRFGRYNMTYLDRDQTAEVDALCGAFMLVRGQVVVNVGLLDEAFFFYGEDLDWCYRIKQAGWTIAYVGEVRVRHWKRVSSRQQPWSSLRSFYQAMRIFHRKHFAARYPWFVNAAIELGISLREGLAMLAHVVRRQEGSR